MTKLKYELLEAIRRWRKTSAAAAPESTDKTSYFAQGYLQGLATAYENAAKRIEVIITNNSSKARQSALRVTHPVLRAKRQPPPIR